MVIQNPFALNSISEPFFLIDRNGFIIDCNLAAQNLTGFSRSELINHSFTIIYEYENDSIKLEYELNYTYKNIKFVTAGWKFKKNRDRFWGDLYFAAIFDGEGKFDYFSCLLINNTEKKLQQIEIQKSESKYRYLIEGVKDYSIFMLDTEGYISTWNEGASRINGYNKSEIIGKHFSIFYIAKDIKDKKDILELSTAKEVGKYEEEGWRVRKNGTLYWASIILTALYNEQNQLLGFSKVTRDLSEKKQNEEKLRQSEERYRSLVEQVVDYGIFLMDEKGRIISWNEGAKRIKGYTAQEIYGKYFSIFYPEEDILNGKPAHELKVAMETGKYEEEGWRLRKDGTRFWANIVITAVYDNERNHIGFSKVTRDLTERKESERVVRESYERVRLMADELKIANTEMKYINQELEQFTSIVSHDLQEPVRTIKSFLKLIDLKLSKGDLNDLDIYIKKSINAANMMRDLIHNLLNYSQLSKDEMIHQPINVKDLINQSLQNLDTTIDIRKAKIVLEINEDKVVGDNVQLIQLIQNLLSNAIKFSDSESPIIRINVIKKDGRVQFSVSDNGIGINKNDYNKVFEIFRRLNTSNSYPGTGIGLAICKKIVDRHQGNIWLESEPGKGTTFYFTLEQKELKVAV